MPSGAAASTAGASSTKKLSATTVYEINTILKSLSDDVGFQLNLKRPLVQEAMDHWAGLYPAESSSKRVEMIKADIGVAQVYPKLRHLEEICNKCGVKVPLDYVREGKKNLEDNNLPSST